MLTRVYLNIASKFEEDTKRTLCSSVGIIDRRNAPGAWYCLISPILTSSPHVWLLLWKSIFAKVSHRRTYIAQVAPHARIRGPWKNQEKKIVIIHAVTRTGWDRDGEQIQAWMQRAGAVSLFDQAAEIDLLISSSERHIEDDCWCMSL